LRDWGELLLDERDYGRLRSLMPSRPS